MEDTITSPYQIINDPATNIITKMKVLWETSSAIRNNIMYKYHSNGFEWGKADCHTMVLELHDVLHNTNYASEVIGNYNDAKSALKFQAYWMDTYGWLDYAGYSSTDSFDNFSVVAIKQHRHFLTGGFCLNKQIIFHTISDDFADAELSAVDIDKFVDMQLPYSIWSK